ncbi:MAG: thioredoxin-related protein [Akkermansiaceae bacterium]|jgi:thioredoxin-related protein
MKTASFIASFIASAVLLSTSFSFAGGEGWVHDFEAAKKKAAEENKDLIVDFTGSDWCGWCIKLNKEVFQHDPFKKGVADTYILVELDYPRDKSILDEKTIQQNEMLKQKYQIQGFPTILITDAKGRPYAKTGYQKGGPEAYLEHLATLQKNKAARDAGFTKAKSAKGVDKAIALFEGLKAVPEDYRNQYAGVIDEIKANDPDDKTGLKAAENAQNAMMGLERDLQLAMESENTEQALSLIDTFVVDQKLEGEKKQEILMFKLNILFGGKDYDALENAVDELIAVEPNSKMGKQMTSFKNTRLKQLKEAVKDE